MRNFIMAIVAFVVPMAAAAQWRLDADVRIGRTNINFVEPWSFKTPGVCLDYLYYDRPSWGADLNIGMELSRGWALYTGLMYDRMRFIGADRRGELPPDYKPDYPQSGMHVFSFVTVPVRVEYRCFRDIIRPYAGLGAGIKCATHQNFTVDSYSWNEDSELKFGYRKVVPTVLFGLNLEYRRFIVGFARRQDLTRFWSEAATGDKWLMAQTTVKIGYRIF